MDIHCAKSSRGILLCTQEYKMHSCVISSDFFCVHKSTYRNVVNARIHQQFYCVSHGGINNLIWIFSLHFDIELKNLKDLLAKQCPHDLYVYKHGINLEKYSLAVVPPVCCHRKLKLHQCATVI